MACFRFLYNPSPIAARQLARLAAILPPRLGNVDCGSCNHCERSQLAEDLYASPGGSTKG
jgi:hypothetical protein